MVSTCTLPRRLARTAPKENVTLYMGLAQIYLSLHDFDTALHYYKATEEHFNMMSPSMQAYFLNNFGNYYYFKRTTDRLLTSFCV